MEYLPEFIAGCGVALVGYFCREVLTELKEIRSELHSVANVHGERIAKLEAVI